MANKDKSSRQSKTPGKTLLEKRAEKHAKSDQKTASRAAADAIRK